MLQGSLQDRRYAQKQPGKLTRLLVVLLIAVLVAMSLSGCSSDGKKVSEPEDKHGSGQGGKAMGRYTESEIPLPEGISHSSIINFQNGKDGNPVLFTKEEKDGKADFSAYLLTDGFAWEKQECRWLDELGLDYEHSSIGLTYGEDGRWYVLYKLPGEYNEMLRPTRVSASEDWEVGEAVEVAAFDETASYDEEERFRFYPSYVKVLENGNLLFSSGMVLYLYDRDKQKIISECAAETDSYFTHGNQYYTVDEGVKNLVSYNGDTGEVEERYPLELEEYYGVQIIGQENGNLLLLSREGIQILQPGSGIWELVVDGERSTMSSPKYYSRGFAYGNEKDYYVCYGSMEENSKLAHYVYDPDMPVDPEMELTIFSLHDNTTIRQVISEFQIKNPEARIVFEPVEEGSGATEEDLIRVLNTELLAGNGPDILIMDGLPEASYVEKGVLEDITDLIEGKIASGDLLEGVAKGCRIDGRIYSVPVKMGLPMAFGRKEAVGKLADLSTFADYVQENPKGQVLGTVDQSELPALYFDAYLSAGLVETGELYEAELSLFLSEMKRILDGSELWDGTREKRPTQEWDLLEVGTFLCSKEVAGFFRAESGTSVVEQAEGELEADLVALNQTFMPYGSIAINKACENKETALRFLELALSEEIQVSDNYDGFSVSQNALEYLAGIERHSADGYGGSIEGVDGRTYQFMFSWPSEPIRIRLVEFCKAAQYPAGRHGKIKQIVLEESERYFGGRASLEDTVEAVMSKVGLVMQE